MSLLTPIDGQSPKMCEQAQAGTRTVRMEPQSGHRAWTGTRSTCPLPDAGEQPVDEITGLALPEHPGLAEFRLRPFTKLELGHRNRPVLAVALGRLVIGESALEDIESFPDDRRVRAGQRMAPGVCALESATVSKPARTTADSWRPSSSRAPLTAAVMP